MTTKSRKRVFIISGISLPLLLIFILSAFTYTKVQSTKKEIFTDVKAYVDKNVIPVLKPMRNELDNALTAEEKATVKELRGIVSELIDQESGFLQKCHSGEIGSDKPLTDEQKKELYSIQKQVRFVITKSWEILDNHEQEFFDIHEELESYHEFWKGEMHEIIKKHIPKPFHKRIEGGHFHGCESSKGMHHGPQHMIHGFAGPIFFILWDTETNFPLNKVEEHLNKHFEMESAQKENMKVKHLQVVIFPNPANNECTVEYTTERKSDVRINVLDKNSIIYKSVVKENQAAGTYQEIFQLSNIPIGTYFIEIQAGKDRITEKLIVE